MLHILPESLLGAMKVSEIRKKFLQFFEHKGHQQVPAAPIVNKEDPTLMFTNAGMNQFKELLLGHQPTTSSTRVMSVQPCLRVSGKHNDLEAVGTDTYHHTMFEMLGNWSFGDYFKEKAIQWAWELITTVYNLPEDRLLVTVFGGDDQDQLGPDQESFSIWKQYITSTRILQCSKQHNFWEMGDTGPCGPCTEIHIDLRPESARKQVPAQQLVNKDHPQVLELWNLVFIQYNRLAAGKLESLPVKHVDTGLGLERLAMVLQAKDASYNTDIFEPLVTAIATMTGKVYGKTTNVDIAIRVIADHLRAATFAIADGQPPTNTKAGYVVRRILRRAVRYGYTHLAVDKPFIYQFVALLAQQWRNVYPHIMQQQAYIMQVIQEEEKSFLRTMAIGLHKLDQLGRAVQQSSPLVVAGTTAFELYDTYGFPLDLTMLLAKERGWLVDEAGFAKALHVQRQRSRQAAVTTPSSWTVLDATNTASLFLGYDQLTATAKIVKYRTAKVKDTPTYQVVLDQTPFYPQGGGQVGDTGQLVVGGVSIEVLDTQKEGAYIIHYLAKLPSQMAAPIQAIVDRERRIRIASNHTATHLLHATLKQLLGAHVAQRGSLVNDRLLRFDFSYPHKPNPQALMQVEHMVNQKIRDNIVLKEQHQVLLSVAKKMGAAALFGEKYGDRVRVITCDPNFSVELCGGTHVTVTGVLGIFKIVACTTVAAGVCRIEAVTALAAERWIHQQQILLDALQVLFKHPQDLVKAAQQSLQEKKILRKQMDAYEATQVRMLTVQLRRQIKTMHGISILIDSVVLPHTNALKQLVFSLRKIEPPFFIVLAASVAKIPHIAVAISEELSKQWSQDAQNIVGTLATTIEGQGGGSAVFAMAKGKNIHGLPQVLPAAEALFYTHVQPS